MEKVKHKFIYKKDYSVYLIIALLICSFLLGNIFFYLAKDYANSKSSSSLNIDVDYSSDCLGMDLLNTSYCLRKELSTFYKYNISERYSQYDLERLKDLGGVCWHFSKFYIDNLRKMGFNAKAIEFKGDDSGHEIALAWTSNLTNGSYCLLDQMEVKCQELAQ